MFCFLVEDESKLLKLFEKAGNEMWIVRAANEGDILILWGEGKIGFGNKGRKGNTIISGALLKIV